MTINQKLTESGEKERLKELLRTRLIECGWRDELKTFSKGYNHQQFFVFILNKFHFLILEVIKSKGLEKITVDELVNEITPRGRATGIIFNYFSVTSSFFAYFST